MHRPPFCPNPNCKLHQYQAAAKARHFWILSGCYYTKVSGRVQRFTCTHCGTGFSERTVSIDYYCKKNLDYREIHRASVEGESVSSIARNLGCKVDSIVNRQERLGRNCIAMQARLLATHHLSEDLSADGFESFDRSQYFPNNINTLIGTGSQFLYAYTHATIRRKGRMTKAQKAKRAVYDELFKPPPAALRTAFSRLMESIDPIWDKKEHPNLVLKTDEHPAYPSAIRRVAALKQAQADKSFQHQQYSSKLARGLHNPLFPVNYYDRELRKDIAAYHRESTCFTRNVANGLERFNLYIVWHNYEKPYRIVSKKEKPCSHAEKAGIKADAIMLEKSRLYRDRAFLSHQKLNDEAKKIWLRGHPTPLKEKAEYCQGFSRIGEKQGSGN